MIDEQALFKKIESLNKEQLSHVKVFVEYLVEKAEKMEENKLRPHGLEKGQIHISPDFDAPLTEFKDYIKSWCL